MVPTAENPMRAVLGAVAQLTAAQAVEVLQVVSETVAWTYNQEEVSVNPDLRHVLDSVSQLLSHTVQVVLEETPRLG